MEIILLERYRKLGEIGDTISVKDGYARNFLIPQSKALRANKKNKDLFEERKKAITQEFEQKVTKATSTKEKLDNKHIVIVKQAGEDERLYGSVNSGEIVQAVKSQLSHDILRSNVDTHVQIKYLGAYELKLDLFADVVATIKLIVARSEEEAKQLILKAQKQEEKPVATAPIEESEDSVDDEDDLADTEE